MILKQFYLNCLAHASYLVGDEQTRTAAVVDPQRDIDQYLAFAARARAAHRARLPHALPRRLHRRPSRAARSRRRDDLSRRRGRRPSTRSRRSPTATRIELGRVRLQALETPGHTPESISIVVYDLDRSATEPHAVLTGDTLFVGDVGRPDLRAALGWSAADLGGLLYDSLRTKLLALPDASLVYPAHGAGSLCGKAIEQGNGLDDRRAAALELRAAADDARRRSSTWSPPISPTRRRTSPTTRC